jgi:cytidine deaminase
MVKAAFPSSEPDYACQNCYTVLMTPDQEQQLIDAALEGIKNSYTRYNKPEDFRVAAAVLTTDGNIYASGSYYSITQSLTLHAEQAVLAHAAAHGEYGIVAIAVISNDPNEATINPCGMCKQLLWESRLRSGQEMEMLFIDNTNNTITQRKKLSEIVTYPWPTRL